MKIGNDPPIQKIHPAQQQKRPGLERIMFPSPVFDTETKAGNALAGKVALITGGDSGIGRAIAVGFAKQGADVAICFLKNERTDAKETKNYISENYGQSQILAMLAAAQFDVLSPHCQGITPVDPPPTLGYYSNTHSTFRPSPK